MARDKSGSPRSDEGSLTRGASSGGQARGETSLKRGRAESVEPTHPSEPPTTAPKKNRLATGQTPSKPLDPDPTPNLDAGASASTHVAAPATSDDIEEDAEGEAREKDSDGAEGTRIVTERNGLEQVDSKDGKEVGEVRRKVAEMTYEEAIELDKREAEDEGREVSLPPKDKDQPDSAMSLETRVSEQGTEVSEKGDGNETIATQKTDTDEGAEAAAATGKNEAQDKESVGEGLKRKALDRSTSSYVDEATTKRARDDDGAENGTAPAQAAAPPVKKTQASFSAFASASPFASAGKSSPFASGGASPFASAGASPFATAGASGSKPPSVFGAKSSGFGGYSSSASPFAKAAPNATEEEEPEEKEETSEKVAKPTATFGDILKADTGPERTGEEKVQMAEQDVTTGEEEEETVYQARAKLYVLQTDGGWRERGVGTVRLNVRRSDQKSPRLVMRAEGVLRLILNVSLYVGITCLEDGKHIRMTVFEDGEVKHITFRTGSNKAASEMYAAIHEHIPVESSGTPAPVSPAKKTAEEAV